MSQPSLKESNFSKTDYHDWCTCINHLNQEVEAIFKQRRDLYEVITEKLSDIFLKHLEKQVKISFKQNGELILVNVPIRIRESLSITENLLNDLCMPVGVRYDNERSILFELYPCIQHDESLSEILKGGDLE